MKKIAAFTLSLMLLLSLVMPVDAANNVYGNYTVEDGSVVFVGAAGSDVTVTAGGMEVGASLSTVFAEEMPITYICMIDCSTSLSAMQKTQRKQVLQTIVDKMRPMDEMVLVKMSDKMTLSKRMDKSAATAAVKEDLTQGYGANIYESVVTLCEKLKDEAQFPGLNYVVLITDGKDAQRVSVSLEDARRAVAETGVAMSAVALVDNFPDGYSKGKANEVKSIAAEAAGGVSFAMNMESIDAKEAASRIVEDSLTSLVVKVDANNLERSGDTVELVVSYADGKQGTVSVAVADLPAQTAPAAVRPTAPVNQPVEPETVPGTEPTEQTNPAPVEVQTEATQPTTAAATQPAPTQPRNTEAPRKSPDMKLYLLIGGGVVAVIAAIVLIILISRRPDDDEYEEELAQASELEFMEVPKEPAAKDIKIDIANIPMEEWKEEPVKPIMPKDDDRPFLVPGYEVELISALENAVALKVYLPVNKGKTVGRSSRADYVLNDTDTGLSGLHFELMWDGRSLHLRDRNSTNGTAVNGTPLKAETWILVRNGATVKAGSYEYRIYGEKEHI